MNQYVVFTLDDRRYALPLHIVDRAVRAVEATPLPKAPDIVMGVIDVQGEVIPVLNVRKRFGLPGRDIDVDDQFIIARTSTRTVALMVDTVVGVVEQSEQEVVAADKIVAGLAYIDGVAKDDEGLALIYNLEKFLSLEDEEALSGAVRDAEEESR